MKRLHSALVVLFLSAASGTAYADVVAGGAQHTLVALPDGTVWAWGSNGYGQLGDGTWTSKNTPVQVFGLTGVVAVAAGQYHSVALKSDGTIWTWGYNGNGQLGDGFTTTRTTPVQAGIVGTASAIAAGLYYTVALLNDGTVWAWGYNSNGQLGDGTTVQANSAVRVSGLTGVTAIAAGNDHSLAVKADGTAWAWGNNSFGQLGDGTTTQRTAPTAVLSLTGVSRVSAGNLFSVAVKSDGTVYAWGYNGSGQLGDNTTSNRTSPVSASGLGGITSVAAGQNHALAVRDDGTVWAWGANSNGQLGDGTTTLRRIPTQVGALSSVTSVAAGHNHSVAITTDGSVWAWGLNSSGQIGDGTYKNRVSPTAVSEGNLWKVGTPTFNYQTGTYNNALTVYVNCATAGATIRYSTDGTEPTESHPSIAPGGYITVDQHTTLKARAWKLTYAPSNTGSEVYTLTPAPPWFNPGGSTYTSAQNVTIATSTTGAVIRYTTDGSDPTDFSTQYTGPVPVNSQLTLKAKAFKGTWAPSATGSATYSFNYGSLAPPTLTPGSGAYVSAAIVSMTAVAGATIRYTTNGAEPTAASTLYSGPIVVEVATTIKAKAFKTDYTASATVTAVFTIAVAPPTISVPGGAYEPGHSLSAASATSNARVHYTITGLDPTELDPVVDTTAPIYVGNFTLKTKAFKTGAEPSPVASATFTLEWAIGPGAVAGGRYHSIAVRPDGTVFGWGKNGPDLLLSLPYCYAPPTGWYVGVQDSREPTPGEPTGIVDLAAGVSHTVALRVDGRVLTWGSYTYQQLGHAVPSGTCNPGVGAFDRPAARLVEGLSNIVAIAAGESHSLALDTDGSLWSWGYNLAGQLGNGSTTSTGTPVAVAGLTNASTIAAGKAHSLAVTADGAVWAWGANGGALGNGTPVSSSVPVRVVGLSDPVVMAAGDQTSYAVLGDGSLWAWGAINSNLTGGASPLTPARVLNLPPVKSVATGAYVTYAVDFDGQLWAWGANTYGQLGDGSPGYTIRNTPGLVPGLPPVRVAQVAVTTSMVIGQDGSIWAWGANDNGKLGDGTTVNRTTPVQIRQPEFLSTATGTQGTPFDTSTDEVFYYSTDAIGSVRVITDRTQQVKARYDYTPFGEQWPSTPPTFSDPRMFAGKERDKESGLDYFGARHGQSQTGRFTSPDPITVNALRIVNPQRWNRYAYAVNNPLKYTDPDGLDALLINYTDGALGFGHVGIMALNSDGSGLYGGFNPVRAGRPSDAGIVKSMPFPPGSIAFGAGGRPTIASLGRLRGQLARLDGKSPQAIRIRHIKTSEAETAALTAYIKQNIDSPARYNAFANNCLDFCVRGLEQAGIPAPPPSAIVGGLIPDLYFRSFLLDLAAHLAEQRLTPRVETSYCIQGIDCR